MKFFSRNIVVRLLAASVLLLSVAACKDDDKKENSNSGNNKQESAVGRVVILNNMEMTYDEVADEAFGNDIFGENSGEEMDEAAQLRDSMRRAFEADVLIASEEEGGNNGSGSTSDFTVEVFTISYPTVDANGNTINLSGTLNLAKINDEYLPVEGILLNCHPTSMGDRMLSQCTFKNLTVNKLAVIEPHYQGFGITKDMPQTYLCQKLIGHQCADMIPAVIQIMKDKGIQMADDMGTAILGYSQGGGNAMATARYIQVEAPANLRAQANVKKVCCGAGPYDPLATFYHWLETDSVSMSMVLPMVIKGMMVGHPEIMNGISLAQYFSEVYLSTGIPQSIDNNTAGMGAIAVDGTDALDSIRWGNEACGPMQYWMKFSGIMSAECANPDSPIRKALEQCLAAEVVSDWVPEMPVEIFSSRKDNVIPYEVNALATYNKFVEKGAPNVTIFNEITLDHLLSQVRWQLRVNREKIYR